MSWSSRNEGKILLALGAVMFFAILVMMVSTVEDDKEERIKEDARIRQIIQEEIAK